MIAPIPENEQERINALHRYQVLDTAPEQAFDDITKLASFICQTPMALVTLIDRDRQWFKSSLGIQGSECPREQAVCAHTILESDTLIVEDLNADIRFSDNPAIKANHLRFYAGAPLLTADHYALGAVCVLDRQPRKLTEEQSAGLKQLSRLVVNLLELRRTSAALADALSKAKTLSELLPICSYCKSIRDDQGFWDRDEGYIQDHTDAKFSHGICPDCMTKHFPEIAAAQAHSNVS
jgi:GAF domain-containing protein